jgi:hypothetical protein
MIYNTCIDISHLYVRFKWYVYGGRKMKRAFNSILLIVLLAVSSCAIKMKAPGDVKETTTESDYLSYFEVNIEETTGMVAVLNELPRTDANINLIQELEISPACGKEIGLRDGTSADAKIHYEGKGSVTVFLSISGVFCQVTYDVKTDPGTGLDLVANDGLSPTTAIALDEANHILRVQNLVLRSGIFSASAEVTFSFTYINTPEVLAAAKAAFLAAGGIMTEDAEGVLSLKPEKECNQEPFGVGGFATPDSARALLFCPVTHPEHCPFSLNEPITIMIFKDNVLDSLCYVKIEFPATDTITLFGFSTPGVDKTRTVTVTKKTGANVVLSTHPWK